MSQPISRVVAVANTPAQAKIYVAMLRAEGIPAFVDGESAADEFAMSQRLMNVSNVRVVVPTEAAAQAEEILKTRNVNAADLERQAMDAGKEPGADRGR